MFKRLFQNNSSQIKIQEDLDSSSSVSDDSEVITKDDLPKPEKRFFLRRPMEYKPTEHSSRESHFRTFDPFDFKKSLKRSKSFSFKQKTTSEPPSLPRSKSVHFAENIATYHEAGDIPSASQNKRNLPFWLKRYKSDEENDEPKIDSIVTDQSEDEGSSDFEESEDLEETESSSSDSESSDETSSSIKDGNKEVESFSPKNVNCSKGQNSVSDSDSKEQNVPFQDKPGRKCAAQEQLQRVFEMEQEEIDKTTEHTLKDHKKLDDELITNAAAENFQFFYEIYCKLCSITMLKAKSKTKCELSQLKRDINSGIGDICEIVKESKTQALLLTAEVRDLKTCFHNFLKQGDFAVSSDFRIQSNSGDRKQTHGKSSESSTTDPNLNEASQPKDAEILASALNKFLEKQRADKELIIRLQQKIAELEKSQHKSEFNNRAREELIKQLAKCRDESQKLQEFQELEKKASENKISVIQHQNAVLETIQSDLEKKVKSLEAEINRLKRDNDDQAKEAFLKISSLEKRNERNKEEVNRLLLKVEQSENGMGGNVIEQSAKKDTHPASISSDLKKLDNFITKANARSSAGLTKSFEKCKKYSALETSNRIAIDSLTRFIKACFEVLIPVFEPETIEQFTRYYYELSSYDMLDHINQSTLTVLCSYILCTIREVVRSHFRNEKMLESEINDRYKYQQQVLDSFSTIMGQVISSKNCSRLSGIQAHSSPKKTKARRKK